MFTIDREKPIKGATLPVIYTFLIFWNYSLLYGKILELSELWTSVEQLKKHIILNVGLFSAIKYSLEHSHLHIKDAYLVVSRLTHLIRGRSCYS